MLKRRIFNEEQASQVIRWVEEQVNRELSMVRVGVSNRHVHLDRKDMDILFGSGSELTRMKDLGQPGQFAAEEVVTLRGTKGELSRIRVLGPLRPETQVEISVTDGYVLGVKPPIRESGMLLETPGIEIIGPKGSIKKGRGVIVASRHIHMLPQEAKRLGLRDKQFIDVKFEGLRGAVLNQVLIRVTNTSALEMHIDMDEANALGVKNNDRAYMVLPSLL